MAKCKKTTLKVKANRGRRSAAKVKKGKRNKKRIEMSNQKSDAEITNWEERDKETLLRGLKIHGEQNLGAIFQMLPHLSPENIKKKIAMYSALAEQLYEDKLINNWLASGVCKWPPLADAIYFISLLEKHPPSSCTNEINFRNIYELIYEIFSGTIDATRLITSQNLKLLLVMLDKLGKTIWPKSRKDLFIYLARNYNKRHIGKVYKGKEVSTL